MLSYETKNKIYPMYKLFKSNPFLYTIWYHSGWLKYKEGLFNNVDLYVDGFPRSGNTYLRHNLKNLLPEKTIRGHLHNIAPIKMALRKKIPTFILVRDVSNCIGSNYMYLFSEKSLAINFDSDLLNFLLRNYIDYYSFVSRQKSINIIPFELLITKPEQVIEDIAASLNVSFSNDVSILLEESMNLFKANTSLHGSSLPSQHKKDIKMKLKPYILNLDRYDEANNLYHKIVS